jgi:hypothetical protein
LSITNTIFSAAGSIEKMDNEVHSWVTDSNRSAIEFLDDPAVGGAVDRAVGEFERQRDELLVQK